MFCPSCSTEVNDQTKYCTRCGLDLRQIKSALSKSSARDLNEWERAALDDWKEQKERRKKKTPEEKRLYEIKGGIIVTCIGIGTIIFFNILFNAIANAERGPDAEILRSLWAVGLVPTMVGIGILFNGIFLSKRIVEIKRRQEQTEYKPLFTMTTETSPIAQLQEGLQNPIPDYSVTEPTTTKLREPASEGEIANPTK